jgi:hypothetical protein
VGVIPMPEALSFAESLRQKILLCESVQNKFCVHGEIGQFSSF